MTEILELANSTGGYIFLGAIVGTTLGLTGSGGGVISIPILVFILGLTLPQAIPISLMTTCISAYIGAGIGLKNGLLRYKAAIFMFFAGLITTPLGMYVAHRTPQKYLIIVFLLLLVVGIYSMLKKMKTELPQEMVDNEIPVPCKLNENGKFIWNKITTTLMGVIGLIIGFFSGLLGAAGGFVVVPALSRISNLTMESIAATSLGVVALVGTSNIIFSAANGNVNWDIGLFFTLGGALGMMIGSYFVEKLSQFTLQVLYVSISACTAIGFAISLFY